MQTTYAVGYSENGVFYLLPLADLDKTPVMPEDRVCAAMARSWENGYNWAFNYFDSLEALRKTTLHLIMTEPITIEALRIRRYTMSDDGECRMEEEWWWEDYGWPKWCAFREKKSGKYLSGTNYAYGGEGSTPIYADDKLRAPRLFARGEISMEMARRGITFKDWDLIEVKLPDPEIENGT